MNATTNERPGRPRASLVAVLALFATVLALGLAALAQDGDQATAPGKLRVEVTEDGVVLHWEAPTSDADTVTGYEIQGRHLQEGVGILRKLTGNISSRRITFTDRTATDPDLSYLYRVRALRADQGSPWSDYVVVEDGQPVAPSAALLELVPTEVVAVAPVEPTAVVEFEPTSAPPVTPAAPLAVPGQTEEAPAAPVALSPPAPLPESSNKLNVSKLVVVIEPEIEPEVELIAEQQQAIETAPELVVTEEEPAPPPAPTSRPASQPQPTASRPEPEPTTSA